MSKLFYFSTVRRVFAFVVLLPPSTAAMLCSLPTFRAYRLTMAFPNHVEVFHLLVSTSPSALGDNMDASRVISLRFCEALTPCFLAYFFQRLTPLHFSPSHYDIPAIATVYGPTLSTTGFTLKAPPFALR